MSTNLQDVDGISIMLVKLRYVDGVTVLMNLQHVDNIKHAEIFNVLDDIEVCILTKLRCADDISMLMKLQDVGYHQ